MSREREQGEILTRVTFRRLEVIKGSTAGDSVDLLLEEGRDESSQAAFRPDERYIVFATGSAAELPSERFPVLQNGQFWVHPATHGAAEYITDGVGLPVIDIWPDRVAVVLPDSLIPERVRKRHPAKHVREAGREVFPQAEDPRTRLTEAAFLAKVRGWIDQDKK